MAQSLAAIRPGGTISVIGILSGLSTKLNLIPILMNQIRLQGIFVGHRKGFMAMNKMVEQHRIRPVIDSVHPLTGTEEAFNLMAGGSHFGKICIKIS